MKYVVKCICCEELIEEEYAYDEQHCCEECYEQTQALVEREVQSERAYTEYRESKFE